MGLIVQLQGLDLPKFQNRCNCSKSIWLGSSLCSGQYRHTFGAIPTPLSHRITWDGRDLRCGTSLIDTHFSDVGYHTQKQWNLWKLAISWRYKKVQERSLCPYWQANFWRLLLGSLLDCLCPHCKRTAPGYKQNRANTRMSNRAEPKGKRPLVPECPQLGMRYP